MGEEIRNLQERLEEALEQIEELKAQLTRKDETIRQLQEENERLKRTENNNSSNSSIPHRKTKGKQQIDTMGGRTAERLPEDRKDTGERP